MTKEKLLAAGFNDDQIKTILEMHKQKLDGEFIPKVRFDEVNEELKTAKTTITERDNQIEGLKQFEGDATNLKETIEKLKTENEQKATEYEGTLSEERKRNAVKLALISDKENVPHDVDMIMNLIDISKIEMDDKGLIKSGFTEQNDNIKKDKPFLFTSNKPNPGNVWKPTGTPPPDGSDKGDEGNKTSLEFGKSLAKTKLEMMGISKEDN